MTSTILLTGATGHIGSALARQMLDQNMSFRALVRDLGKAKPIRHTNVELLEGDFGDRDSLKKAMKGVEKVFLCSSASKDQVELQGNVVEAAYHSGVKHIVKVSALGTDHDSDISILRWHAATEDQIRDYKMVYTFLRPHDFMQNMFRFADSIKSEGVFRSPLKAPISSVDVEDIATVAFKSLTVAGHENHIYTVTGPKAISHDDVAAIMSKELGKKVKHETITLEEARSAMDDFMPDWLVEDLIRLYKFYNSGLAGFVSATMEDVTGRKARSFETFLKDNISVFQS